MFSDVAEHMATPEGDACSLTDKSSNPLVVLTSLSIPTALEVSLAAGMMCEQLMSVFVEVPFEGVLLCGH